MSKINKIKVEDTTYDIQDNTSGFITKDVNNLTNYELKTATGNSIEMSIDSSTYVMTLSLKNSQGTILNTQTVDLPLETMVVGGTYDSTNKKIVLTLKNGNTIDVPIGDLINGLQSEITSTNKLDASLVDDSLSNNKFVTLSEKTIWNNKSDFSGDYNDLTNKPVFNDVAIKGITTNSSSEPFDFRKKSPGIYLLDTSLVGQIFHYRLNDTSVNTITFKRILYIYITKNTSINDEDGVIGYYFYINELTGNSKSRLEYSNITYSKSSQSITLDNNMIDYGYMLNGIAQTIFGIKTFNAIPRQSNTLAPTLNNEFTNKKYVDDSIASAITTTLNGSY